MCVEWFCVLIVKNNSIFVPDAKIQQHKSTFLFRDILYVAAASGVATLASRARR